MKEATEQQEKRRDKEGGKLTRQDETRKESERNRRSTCMTVC
jgi:hypothetical protein